MPGLSTWAVRRPVLALIAWLVTVAAIGVLGIGFGGNYNDSFDLPDTESKAATDLLIESGTDTSGLESGATIVWKPSEGPALSEETATTIVPMLEEMAEFESITCVTNPFDPASTGFGSDCPSGDQNAALFELLTPEEIDILSSSFAPVSPDGTVAYASVSFVGDGTEGLPMEEAAAILELIEETNSDSLAVGAEGQVLDFAGGEPPSSEIIGVIFALVILLIAFGSVIAAGLPILTAIVGVGTGVLFVTFVANFLDVATFAPTLAAMIGLAVGIDYSLFILNRYRQGLLEGDDKQKAALVAVKTSGRAVVFAAFAVVVGLLGLLLIGINFFIGLSIGAAMTVVIVMLSAVWMLPALLGLLGTRALGWRLPWGRKPGSGPAPSKGWSTYARWLQKRPILPAIGAIGLIVLLAIPAFSLRQGFTDNSGRPEGSPARIAYDLRAEGFGPGASAPYLVVVDLSEATDPNAYAQIVTTLNETPGVAGTNPSPETLPVIAKIAQAAPQEAANPIQVMAVYATTPPQDAATSELLTTLREDVNPALEQATGATILVGGTAAITADFTTVLADALPIFLLVVVGLGFLALVVLFRSLLVPFIGASHVDVLLGGCHGDLGCHFPVGLVQLDPRRPWNRTDSAFYPDHGVRDLVRAVDGLSGLPGVADARRVVEDQGQRREHSLRPAQLRQGGRHRGADHGGRLWGVRSFARRDHQVVRRCPRVRSLGRCVRGALGSRPEPDDDVRDSQLVVARVAGPNPAHRHHRAGR